MVCAGLGLAAFGLGGISVGAALLGCVIGLVLMMPGYALGATGAGDVKLMAAVGSLLGPLVVVYAVLYTAIAGGVLAVIVALERRRLGTALAGTGRMIASPGDVKREIAAAGSREPFRVRSGNRGRQHYRRAVAVGKLPVRVRSRAATVDKAQSSVQ